MKPSFFAFADSSLMRFNFYPSTQTLILVLVVQIHFWWICWTLA